MRGMAEATADPVFDMLATIAVDQGADPDEVACAADGWDYWLAVRGEAYVLSAFLLEEGVWPALHASGLAANANRLPVGTDLAAYARRYAKGSRSVSEGVGPGPSVAGWRGSDRSRITPRTSAA
jgi:hypothetical protein